MARNGVGRDQVVDASVSDAARVATRPPVARGVSRPTLRLEDCGDTLTASDLAAVLQIDRSTLDRWRKQGDAPEPLPLPGHPRWSKEQVRRFLAGDVRATRGFRRRF